MSKPATPRLFSPYGGYHDGDQVTRDGTDVHEVRNMQEDGFGAEFVCIVAPATGWCVVGDVEFNICRRYALVKAQ